MNRAVISCHACRYSLLEAFAGLAGVTLPARPSRFLKSTSQSVTYQKRCYSSSPFLRQSPPDASAQITQDPLTEVSPTPPPPASTDTSDDSKPWYLSIPTPEPPAPISPLLALQEIPPLPNDPPTILSPILKHLSVSIGLDNLALIDLRHLDPPSALGANLLMIIGTARSVKHLNVSADRFCRWLRTEYGLRPYADGLLGRNELKLKLRRKARRQKMMGLVGAGGRLENADDGITTGWVCVNVGAVDDSVVPRSQSEESLNKAEAEAETEPSTTAILSETESTSARDHKYHLQEDEEEEYQNPSQEDQHKVEDNYVGFGSSITSPRIVVQMFTEEKRLEMDIEGLWEHRNMRRSAKAKAYISRQQDGEAEDQIEEGVPGGGAGGAMDRFDGMGEVNEAWERAREKERERKMGGRRRRGRSSASVGPGRGSDGGKKLTSDEEGSGRAASRASVGRVEDKKSGDQSIFG